MNSRQIEFAGAEGNRLAADQIGEKDGPLALFLHGGGQTRHSWGEAAQRLAGHGWQAITLDQRGHGDSAWVDSGAYAFYDFADDCAAVCRQIAGKFGRKPVAIGASLGGLASIVAQGESDDAILEGLVLVDITPTMNPNGVAAIQRFMRANMHEGFADIEQAADAVAAYLPHRRRPRNSEGLRKNLRQDADGRYRWHWDPRFLDGPRPINTGRETGLQRLIAATRNLKLPTLLIRGGQSELVDEAHVEEFLGFVPHAHYTDISEAGHMVAGDMNDVFADAVISFLRNLRVETSV